jgi:hypothetical protein
MNLHVLRGAAFVVGTIGALTTSTLAQIVEVEPNNSKATATPALLLDVGATITGSSTGATNQAGPNSADEFLVSTVTRPLGIYRWRLRLTSAQAHTLTLRGRNQVGGVIGTADVIHGDHSAAIRAVVRSRALRTVVLRGQRLCGDDAAVRRDAGDAAGQLH